MEAGMFRIKVQPDSFPREGSLLGLRTAAFFLCPHMAFPLIVHGKREREGSLVSLLIRALILSDQGATLWSHLILIISFFQIQTHWESGLQYMNFDGGWGHKHSVHKDGKCSDFSFLRGITLRLVLHHLPQVPVWPSLRFAQGNLFTEASCSAFVSSPTSQPVLPEVTAQVNYLSSIPYLRIPF